MTAQTVDLGLGTVTLSSGYARLPTQVDREGLITKPQSRCLFWGELGKSNCGLRPSPCQRPGHLFSV